MKNELIIPEDLGQIEFLRDHPQILEKLIERSKSKSLDPFIKNKTSDVDTGGFNWNLSPESHSFWQLILSKTIERPSVEHFYTKYPKETTSLNASGSMQGDKLESPTTKSLTIQKQKDMRVFKTKTVEINGKSREITLAVVIVGSTVKAGYSIKNPADETDPKLAKTIAEGRALKDKTNILELTMITETMKQKYILFAIAENLFSKITRGQIVLKGL